MRQNLQFPDGKTAIKSINGLFADTTGNITININSTVVPFLLTRPTYDDGLHLEMFYALQDDYSDEQQLINTKTVANDRNLVRAFGGTSWIVCPAEGFGSLFDKAPVKVILSSKLDTTKIYNIKYRWVSMTSDTSVSDWYGMVYPCCTEPMI